jgi:hypothetical protein
MLLELVLCSSAVASRWCPRRLHFKWCNGSCCKAVCCACGGPQRKRTQA